MICFGFKKNPGLGSFKIQVPLTHSIHGTGIFTYIWLNLMVNVGTVNIPYMDGMGETNIDKKNQAVKTDATGRRSGFLLRMPFFSGANS